MTDEGRVRSDTGPFAVVPVWLLYVGLPDPGAIGVYAALASFADQHGVAFPGRRRLAEMLGVSLSTIDRRLRELVDVGALIIRPHADETGRQTTNRYYLRRARPASAPVVLSGPVTREGRRDDDLDLVTGAEGRTRTRGTRATDGVSSSGSVDDDLSSPSGQRSSSTRTVEEIRADDLAAAVQAVDEETARARIADAHEELRRARGRRP